MVTTPSGRRAVDADGVPFTPVGVPAANLPTVKGEGVGLETAMAVLASLPPDLAVQAAERYITTYEMISSNKFVPGSYPAASRIEKAMRDWGLRS